MKLSGIVCEYNPFHKGHKFHIEETKRKTDCDGVVAVMSGNFVQRGEGAVFSKEVRAKAAIDAGADLVLELSPFFSVRSAEQFALGAVKILSSIPEIKYISFGAEEEDTEKIKKAAEILINEPEDYKAALKEELKKGVSYPVARENALLKIGEDDAAKVLKEPNNILGVEYLKAIKRLDSNISPVSVKRIGAGHDSLKREETVSASYLRGAFYSGDERDFVSGLPEEVVQGFLDATSLNKSGFEKMIFSKIITMSEDELREISEVSEGLENRIKKAAQNSKSFDELLTNVKSKRYTLSKIRRILLCAGLGIKKEEFYSLPPYAKILAFSENGQRILNTIKKSSDIPVIKNMTALKRLKDNHMIDLYLKEAELDRLYSLYTEEQ